MIQFIWDKKNHTVMPKTIFAISEFINEEVINVGDTWQYETDDESDLTPCLNHWYMCDQEWLLDGDMRFVRMEKEIIE